MKSSQQASGEISAYSVTTKQNFFASLNPNGTHDYFKLRFVGFVPNDLVGNRLIGKIVTVTPAHKHTGKKPSFIPH